MSTAISGKELQKIIQESIKSVLKEMTSGENDRRGSSMKKFVLGYRADSLFTEDSPELLEVFKDEEEADEEAEEWCVVFASSLEKAKQKYEKAFTRWQRENEA